MQRDAWVQASKYPDLWSTALSLTPRDNIAQRRDKPLGAADDLNSVLCSREEDQGTEDPPRGDPDMTPQ